MVGTTVVLVDVVVVVGDLVDVEGNVTDVVPLVLILVVVVVVIVAVVVLVVAAVVVDADVGIITVDVRAELVNGLSEETLQVPQQMIRRYESRQSTDEQLASWSPYSQPKQSTTGKIQQEFFNKQLQQLKMHRAPIRKFNPI